MPAAANLNSPRALRACALALLLLFAARVAFTARRQSVTVDEFAHLPAGIAYLTHGAFHVHAGSPPLARMIEALPALAFAPTVPPIPPADGRPSNQWPFAYAFLAANRAQYLSIFSAGRAGACLLGVALALAVYGWSRRLWGPMAALASLAIVAFDPNLIAHSGLVTTDVGFCAFSIAALAACERCLTQPGWRPVALASLALGAAQLTKLTAVILYPAIVVAALLAARPLGRALGRLAAVFCLSLLVVNAGYLFRGTLTPASEYSFRSSLGRALDGIPLRIPLPRDYVRGFDEQAFEAGAVYHSYLNGTVYDSGAPWYYDLEAVALKTPLAELALAAAAIWLLARRAPRQARLGIALCGATAGLMLLSASLTRLDIGVRYVLLVFPLAAVAVGGVARRCPRAAAAGLLLLAVESAAATTRELSFFNLLAGGPGGGHRYLADSNLDWGQDLPALRDWMRARGVGALRLAYFGRVDPRLYGIEFELPAPGAPQPGWYAVSTNFLVGLPYLIRDERADQSRWLAPGELSDFARMRPAALIGDSIRVFQVPEHPGRNPAD